jgi:universal stress protein A
MAIVPARAMTRQGRVTRLGSEPAALPRGDHAMPHPTILCPIDFSDASRGALRYALAIAAHFGAAVTLLAVHDPLLNEVADLQAGARWLSDQSDRELRHFFGGATRGRDIHVDVTFRIASGKPATEILKHAREQAVDLIVMSSRGLSGVRKLFFGATTERVLRETRSPVLVTPAHDPGPADLASVAKVHHHVLVPLDFSPQSRSQLHVAHTIAAGLGASLVVAHIVEPLWFATAARPRFVDLDNERRHRAETSLANLVATLPDGVRSETLTLFGDPAEELAKLAKDRRVGLIVMGLHGSPSGGQRMGSVTYRILCLAPTVVLALPPGHHDAPADKATVWG